MGQSPAGGTLWRGGPCSPPRVQPQKQIASVAVSRDLTRYGPPPSSATRELARKYQAVVQHG